MHVAITSVLYVYVLDILILGIQKQMIPMFFQNCTETITQKIPKEGFELTLTDLKRIHHS